MKPKRQEDSSCVFAYYFVAALADAAIPQEKKERRNRFGADSECGAGHTGYRTSFDPSPGGSQDTGRAFRSRVQRPGVRGCSPEQRSNPPHRSVLTQHK